MPTLSMEGSVFQADSLTRKELVQFAPFAEHDNIVVSPDNVVSVGDTTVLCSAEQGSFSSFFFHLQEGEVKLFIKTSAPTGFATIITSDVTFTTTGTYLITATRNFRGASIRGLGTDDSLYDWVYGNTPYTGIV